MCQENTHPPQSHSNYGKDLLLWLLKARTSEGKEKASGVLLEWMKSRSQFWVLYARQFPVSQCSWSERKHCSLNIALADCCVLCSHAERFLSWWPCEWEALCNQAPALCIVRDFRLHWAIYAKSLQYSKALIQTAVSAVLAMSDHGL